MTNATVNVRLADDHVHVSLEGKVDTANAATVEGLINAALGDMAVDIAIDLTDLRDMDTRGQQVLASLASRISDSDVALALAMPAGAEPREMVERSGLASLAVSEQPGEWAVDQAELGQKTGSGEIQLDPDIGEAEAEEAGDLAQRFDDPTHPGSERDEP
jgi:anti-anti-sigma factor